MPRPVAIRNATLTIVVVACQAVRVLGGTSVPTRHAPIFSAPVRQRSTFAATVPSDSGLRASTIGSNAGLRRGAPSFPFAAAADDVTSGRSESRPCRNTHMQRQSSSEYSNPRILDRARHAVIAARCTERGDERAGLQDAIDFRPKFGAESNFASVPSLAHKASRRAHVGVVALGGCRVVAAESLNHADQRVRRVCAARIYGIAFASALTDAAAVAFKNFNVLISVQRVKHKTEVTVMRYKAATLQRRPFRIGRAAQIRTAYRRTFAANQHQRRAAARRCFRDLVACDKSAFRNYRTRAPNVCNLPLTCGQQMRTANEQRSRPIIASFYQLQP